MRDIIFDFPIVPPSVNTLWRIERGKARLSKEARDFYALVKLFVRGKRAPRAWRILRGRYLDRTDAPIGRRRQQDKSGTRLSHEGGILGGRLARRVCLLSIWENKPTRAYYRPRLGAEK